MIYAGKISNALESAGPDNKSDPEKSQWQGINQQGTNEKLLNKEFYDWFIGFVEGDGCFYISRGKSIFSIHLHLVDLPLLLEIKSQLNMGTVHIGKKSCLLTIKAKKEVEELIHIFNGKIYLSKRRIQFANWVKNFCAAQKKHFIDTTFNISNNNFKPSLFDNWLAGFIDGEGSFMVSVSKKKIVQRIVISQKDAELEIKHLSNMLNGYTEKWKGHDRLVINFSSSSCIISYLNYHKLYSTKAKSYDKWIEIYNIRKNSSDRVLEVDTSSGSSAAAKQQPPLLRSCTRRNIKYPLDYISIKKKASLINSLRKAVIL